MRTPILLALTLCAGSLIAQIPPSSISADPLASLDFLLGTWSAKTDAAASSAGALGTGTYTFHRDLNGHALIRSSSSDTCKGPANFDCSHHDQLTIFADPNALAAHKSSLLALYLDKATSSTTRSPGPTHTPRSSTRSRFPRCRSSASSTTSKVKAPKPS